MSQTIDIMKRIQKYDGINLFLVLDKNGKKLNPELDEEEKKNIPNAFNTTYTEIPNLVNKAISCVRDIEPLNELTFLQISYSGYEFLIAPDEDQCVFAALQAKNK
jgi:dynein light chain roadblock-type